MSELVISNGPNGDRNFLSRKKTALNAYHCTLHYMTHQVKPKSINLQKTNMVNTFNSEDIPERGKLHNYQAHIYALSETNRNA